VSGLDATSRASTRSALPGQAGRRPPRIRAFVGRPTSGPRESAAWTRRRIIANNLHSVVGRAYPRVRGLTREPSWILFEMLLPFLTTSAFVFVYRALDAPASYIGFVVLGGAMSAFWLNVVWMMAAQLYWEKDQGNLELYFAAPMNLMSVLFGMAAGGLVMSSTRAVVVLVVATVVYKVSFSVDQWGLLLAVFLLTLAALYGFGMMLASLFLMWGREAWHMTQLMVEPVYFVSGLNFPVGRLGMLGAVAIALIPLAVGLDAMRQLAFASTGPTGTPSPEIEALILVAMTIVFTILARWLLHSMEIRARQEGRLTVRWR
jgi:ABC-2 type transport system permease protein